jgi:hypothetical protein
MNLGYQTLFNSPDLQYYCTSPQCLGRANPRFALVLRQEEHIDNMLAEEILECRKLRELTVRCLQFELREFIELEGKCPSVVRMGEELQQPNIVKTIMNQQGGFKLLTDSDSNCSSR